MSLYSQIDYVDQVSPISVQRCVSVSVEQCLYDHMDEVDMVSPMYWVKGTREHEFTDRQDIWTGTVQEKS